MSRAPASIALALALGAGMSWPGTASSQTKTGTTLAQFLLVEPSARVAGMGNAGVALFDGLQSVYYNPAAIGHLTGRQGQFSHVAIFADIDYNYLAGSLPIGSSGHAVLSATSLNSGDIEVRTVEAPLGTGERYTVSDIALALGYGRRFSDRFAAGIQVAYIQETIWHSSVSTFTVSAGTLYRLAENGLHIGSSLSHFGVRGRYEGRDLRILFDQDPERFGDNSALPADQFTDEFPLPVFFRVGVGLPVKTGRNGELQLAVDAFHPSDNSESVSAGAEWTYRELIALRAGYQNLFQRDSETGLTLGAGVQGSLDRYTFGLDYAWTDQGRLDEMHRLTVAVRF